MAIGVATDSGMRRPNRDAKSNPAFSRADPARERPNLMAGVRDGFVGHIGVLREKSPPRPTRGVCNFEKRQDMATPAELRNIAWGG